MSTELILGTAGHIDHGKTSLVKALTGVDTDRLPEEKKRGITIELGFARLDLGDVTLGIVDVPGHERFVRNMLAGATGIDLALLVVAADDSVKPQTREHLEILRLLDLEFGVIALTKCDLPDPAWLTLVEEEVRELVAGTFLAQAPLVHTSAHTGAGLAELREALERAGQAAAASPRLKLGGPFRMAVDRSFTIAGHGTVVTGSVAGGAARLGDELVIEPGGLRVRVRGLQSHDQPVEEVHRGQRAAINLAGVHHQQIGRGQELAAPGHLVPSRLMTAQVHLLPSAPRPLKHRSRVTVHLGTAELAASVALLDCDALQPGSSAAAQFFFSEPAVATWRQAFVLRSPSPAATIGGGQVLDPHAAKIRRGDAQRVARLAGLGAVDPVARASAALYFAGLRDWRSDELTRLAGVDDPQAAVQALVERGELEQLALPPHRTVRVHRDVLQELRARIESVLARLHQHFPLNTALERSRLASKFRYLEHDALFDAVLRSLADAGRVRLTDREVALAGHGPKLSANERTLLESIVGRFEQAGFQPPTVAEVAAQAAKNQAAVPDLIKLAAAGGRLVKVSAEFYVHAEVEQRMRQMLAERLAGGEGLTVSQIREILGTTRKYALPLCEYLDRIGFTRRQGDVRVLGQAGVKADA